MLTPYKLLFQVEWAMQDLKGRRTIITEGNAKGSYVSYVIEEDVSTTQHLYVQRNTLMYNDPMYNFYPSQISKRVAVFKWDLKLGQKCLIFNSSTIYILFPICMTFIVQESLPI